MILHRPIILPLGVQEITNMAMGNRNYTLSHGLVSFAFIERESNLLEMRLAAF